MRKGCKKNVAALLHAFLEPLNWEITLNTTPLNSVKHFPLPHFSTPSDAVQV